MELALPPDMRPTVLFVTGLLASLLLGLAPPIVAHAHDPRHMIATTVLASLLASCASWLWLADVRPQTIRVARLWTWSLGLTWLAFWLTDLHRARFQLVTLLPALLWLLGRTRSRPWSIAGQLAAWCAVWGLMADRADNGCTGVSHAYSTTQIVLGALLFLGGPFALASCGTEGRKPSPGRRTPASAS